MGHGGPAARGLVAVAVFVVASLPARGAGKMLVTNAVRFHDAPEWLGESRLERAVTPIEDVLEWRVRRIDVYRHASLERFSAESSLRFGPVAFFRRKDGTIHLGPKVTDDNFDRVFGHELVHAIFWQKYRGAIPVWLEEGLANYLGRRSPPDYRWLAAQPRTPVTKLVHPDRDETGSRYHYEASTAAIAMIAAKCSLRDLLQLSVGRKMTTYLSTYCEIRDVDQAFDAWLAAQAGEPGAPTARPGSSGTASEPWWKKPREKAWWDKKDGGG
jgi:hypothetical protein